MPAVCLLLWFFVSATQAFVWVKPSQGPLSLPATTTRLGSAILPLDGPSNRVGTSVSSPPANVAVTDISPSELRIAADICIEAFFGPPDRNPIRKMQLQTLYEEQMNDLRSRFRQSVNNRMMKAVDENGYMVGFVELGLTQGVKYGMPEGVPERDWRPVLSNLAVRTDMRRAGIGTRLAQACEEVALQWGCDEIILQVEEDNKAARTLYKNMGYVDCFIDRAARKYDLAGMSIKNVPVSKITMRKAIGRPNPIQQLISSFFATR